MLNNQRVHMTTLFLSTSQWVPAKSASAQLDHPRSCIALDQHLNDLWLAVFPPLGDIKRHQTALARDSLSNKWGKTYHYISFIWKSIVKSVNKAGKCTQAGNWPRKMNLLASLMAQLPGVRMGLVFTTPQLSGNYIWIIFKYWSIWRT